MATYKVSGRGAFPIDMLRFDCAWPLGPSDAAAIEDSIAGRTRRFEVTLVTNQCHAPNVARWNSFLCKVDDHGL